MSWDEKNSLEFLSKSFYLSSTRLTLKLSETFLLIFVRIFGRNFKVMQVKCLLRSRCLFNSIYRRYVSTVSVNVKSLGVVRVKPQDYLESSNDEVKVKLFDKEHKEIDVNKIKAINIQSSTKAFKIDCDHCGGEKNLTMILELPLGSTPEIQLQINTKESNIHVANLQTKSVAISSVSGNVFLKNLKSGSITTETDSGNISTKSLLLGKTIKLSSKSGVSLIENIFHF